VIENEAECTDEVSDDEDVEEEYEGEFDDFIDDSNIGEDNDGQFYICPSPKKGKRNGKGKRAQQPTQNQRYDNDDDDDEDEDDDDDGKKKAARPGKEKAVSKTTTVQEKGNGATMGGNMMDGEKTTNNNSVQNTSDSTNASASSNLRGAASGGMFGDVQTNAAIKRVYAVKVEQLAAGGVYAYCEGRVYCIGSLHKSTNKTSMRRFTVIFRSGELVCFVVFGDLAEKLQDKFAIGQVISWTKVRASRVNPIFPVTDTEFELLYTAKTETKVVVENAGAFPKTPTSKLSRTWIFEMPTKPLNERLDMTVKLLRPNLSSQMQLREYNAGQALPTEITLAVVDESNNIAKLVFDSASGLHSLKTISDMIIKFSKRTGNAPLVLQLRSVIHAKNEGRSVISFKNLSAIHEDKKNSLVKHPIGKCNAIFPARRR
jgi:hypothetical protein